MSYQLINIVDATQNILCPYCHYAVLDWEQEQYIQPCEHTLFMAMDLGFEYASDVFEQSMQTVLRQFCHNRLMKFMKIQT